MLLAFLSTLLFSLSVVSGHRSAKLIGGTEANFWRQALAALLLGIWAYGFGQGLEGDAFPVFLVSGVVGIGIGDLGLFQALPRLGSRLSLLIIQCLSAPFGALIEWFWLGTPLHSFQVGCGIVILTGVAIALAPSQHLKLTPRAAVVGTMFAVMGAIGGATGAVLSRKAYAISHHAHQPISGANAAFQRIVGGLFLAGICLLFVRRRDFWNRPATATDAEMVKAKWRAVGPWVAANALAGQTLGVSCMQRAFETTPTGLVLSVIATTPVVVMPLAYLLEGERPSKHAIVGGIIAVAGVVGLAMMNA
jgi:drug/metabolite transporter (DMT)-like permease